MSSVVRREGRAQRAQVEHDESPRRPGSSRPTGRADDPRAAVPHQPEDLGGAQPRVLAPRRARAAGRGPCAPRRACRRRRRCPCRRGRARRSTPAATSRRSGATPAARRRFEERLCTTVAPVRASELDVGVAQPDAVRERAALAEHARVARAARARARRRSASPQARCSRLSSECRWIPVPSSAAAAPTASTSSSLAHCGAMIANCALSSGSPASSPHEVADRRDVGLVRHATRARGAAPAPAARAAARR